MGSRTLAKNPAFIGYCMDYINHTVIDLSSKFPCDKKVTIVTSKGIAYDLEYILDCLSNQGIILGVDPEKQSK